MISAKHFVEFLKPEIVQSTLTEIELFGLTWDVKVGPDKPGHSTVYLNHHFCEWAGCFITVGAYVNVRFQIDGKDESYYFNDPNEDVGKHVAVTIEKIKGSLLERVTHFQHIHASLDSVSVLPNSVPEYGPCKNTRKMLKLAIENSPYSMKYDLGLALQEVLNELDKETGFSS